MGYRISVYTDKSIREFSRGEVTNYGRYNFKYKVPKPISGGLFCEKIFGPVIDFTCNCGIYRKGRMTSDFKSSTCSECGVSFLPSLARNNRFGHIETHTYHIVPIAYNMVSKILGINEKALKAISLGQAKALLVESDGPFYTAEGDRFKLVLDDDGDISSIHELVVKLKENNVDGDISMMENTSDEGRVYFKEKYSLYDFFNSCILVTPPTTRDMKKVGDRVGYGEINVLYSRMLRESLRVQAVLSEDDSVINATDKLEIIKFESQIIQKLMNMTHIDGSEYGSVNIPPILENMKGKGGIFRGTLLGKRVDYSGRTVITSGPNLPIDSMGVPSKMMHELLKPHLIRELTKVIMEDGEDSIVKAMKLAIREHSKYGERVKQLIEVLCKSSMLLVNRAPSLHRYSVMTFNIVVHYGKCIYFPPLACKPFNADNDGDCVAIHLCLSDEVLEETKITSFTNNLMSSANFDTPNAGYSHEMIVGSYLLSNQQGV